MKEVLVSIIIPCYNYGIYIEDTVQSILCQTYKKVEIIIVDSGSDDLLTLKKLRSYKKRGYKVFFSNQRISPSIARNIGFQHSLGDLILPLDADDLIERTFVEKSVNYMNNNLNVGAVSCTTLYFGFEDGMLFYRGGYIENLLYNLGCTVCGLVRREIWEKIGGFDENMILGYEDWDFWISLTKLGWSIYIIPETLFFYRQKESSRVQTVFDKHDEIFKYIKKKHEDVYTNSLDSLLKRV